MNRVIHARSFRKGKRRERRKNVTSVYNFLTLSHSFPFVTAHSFEKLLICQFFSHHIQQHVDWWHVWLLIHDEYQRMWKYVEVWHEKVKDLSIRGFYVAKKGEEIEPQQRESEHICWIVYDKGQIRFISMMNCRKWSCLEWFWIRELDLIDLRKWIRFMGQ